MTKLFLLLLFTFSLASNCENKKIKKSSNQDKTEMPENKEPHDSIFEKYETPPIIPADKKLPPKKNDSI